MNSEASKIRTSDLLSARVDRRSFFRQSGMLGLGAATSGLLIPQAFAQSKGSQETEQAADTVAEIFTAALVAEDLATTFYYNGLVGKVVQDPALAGPGGSANHAPNGNLPNLQYIQAALTEEINHADLFRKGLGGSKASSDPYQTFYFPQGTFDTLSSFLGILSALENAFIGAYLNAIQEFALMSAHVAPGSKYTATELQLFAKIAASIMGIECEHRVLGNVIGNVNPSNNLNYEQTDGLNAVYNGPHSALAALTPFVTPSTGPAFSLQTALEGAPTVGIIVPGTYATS